MNSLHPLLPLTGSHVLLVDDHPDSLEVITFLFASAGALVSSTLSGLDALRMLQTQPLDLLVSDIHMPEVNGYRLAQELRRQCNTPAIAVSADFDRERAIAAGFSAYFVKPVDITSLLNTAVALCHPHRR
jgi:CheY-like chemotaxis protein